MKKIIILLALVLCLTACGSNEESTSTSTIDTSNLNEEIVDYFDKYDSTMSEGDDQGYVYCFDDGSEYGVALVIRYDDAQIEELNSLDFASDTYFEDLETIAKQSTDYEFIDLNELAPTEDEFDSYIGQEMGVMFDDGYEEWGYMLDETTATFTLQNEMYNVNVEIDETIDEDDLSTNFERSLIVANVTFNYLSDDYFYSLIDGE